jgi:hypothetical protein
MGETRLDTKFWAAIAAIVFALVLLILGLVALTRCPAGDIPAVVHAFGSWLHVAFDVRL